MTCISQVDPRVIKVLKHSLHSNEKNNYHPFQRSTHLIRNLQTLGITCEKYGTWHGIVVSQWYADETKQCILKKTLPQSQCHHFLRLLWFSQVWFVFLYTWEPLTFQFLAFSVLSLATCAAWGLDVSAYDDHPWVSLILVWFEGTFWWTPYRVLRTLRKITKIT